MARCSRRFVGSTPARLDQPAFLPPPAWRGAAPVQAAIAAGDEVTGEPTTFQIEPALDSGPVYGVVTETIRPSDTAGDLLDRLSVSGAALLETTMDGVADETLSPVPQPSDGVTVAPKVTVRRRARALGSARPCRREADQGGHSEPGRVDHGGRLANQARARDHRRRGAELLSPGAIRADRGGVRVGTASQPVLLGASSRRAKSRWRPRTGREVPGSTSPRRRHDKAPQAAP